MVNYPLRGKSIAMITNLFTIGEVSSRKRISKKALRFYEKIGLIKPFYVNPSTRYRYYSIDQFICLDIIKAARAMGISPKDLKQVMAKRDMTTLAALLDEQGRETIRKIEELTHIVRSMDGIRKAMEYARSSISKKDVYPRWIPKRTVIAKAIKHIASTEDAVLEFSEFDRIMEDNRLINTYEAGMIFKNDGDKGFIPARIFNTVESGEHSNTSIISAIPSGMYLCVCYDQENARRQNMKMTGYLNRHGILPKAVVQIELMNDVFSAESNFFELQVLCTGGKKHRIDSRGR
jgi:DNA-binding transcriptional MerR regulator